jgi:undecaprenyl-diphosphatase
MEWILTLDRELFLELNGGFRSPLLDQIMAFLSTTYAWIPLHLFLLYLLGVNFRGQTWVWLAAIGLTILLADQISSSVMKPLFERLRPSHDPDLTDKVFLVNGYRGGRYGFASSHAANTFGVATLLWFVLKKYRPWIGLLFIWALLVGYTRIYLGVHYPGDILGGFVIGFLCALVTFKFFLVIIDRLNLGEKLTSE